MDYSNVISLSGDNVTVGMNLVSILNLMHAPVALALLALGLEIAGLAFHA